MEDDFDDDSVAAQEELEKREKELGFRPQKEVSEDKAKCAQVSYYVYVFYTGRVQWLVAVRFRDR